RSLGLVENRSRLAGRHLLRRVRGDGPAARRLDRPGTGVARLYARYWSDGVVAFRVCAVCRWILVGAAVAHACRHRLGRDVYAGPQGDRRSARGNITVA